MDNLKLELKFKETKKALQKAWVEPDTIIDIVPYATAGIKDLELDDKSTFCMRLQKLIQEYKSEGVIDTGNEYHSFLATLPNRSYVPRDGFKLTGLHEDQIMPEIFIRSTERFKEIHGEEELSPQPSSPLHNTYIQHYQDNSIHTTASAIDRSMIGGSDSKTSSLNKEISSQQPSGVTVNINRLLEHKSTKRFTKAALIFFLFICLVMVINYMTTGRPFKFGPISSGDAPSPTTQNNFVISESEKQRSAELSFALKDKTSYDCNLCFINSSKPYNGVRQSHDDDQILFVVAVNNIGSFAATSILDDSFFLSSDKTEKGSDVSGYIPEDEWIIDDPENRPKIVANGSHTFVYKISKEAMKRFKGYFAIEVKYKDENGDDKKLEKAIYIDRPILGINYTEFDKSQIPLLRKDYYRVMGYDENGFKKMSVPSF